MELITHPVYCTIDPGRSENYLVLPRGWNDSPWVGTGHTVLDVRMDRCPPRLYILAHGPIWFDRSYWRIILPGIHTGLYPHPVTGLWSSKPAHLPIRAERTSYDALRLEAVFGYSVWGGAG